MLEIVYDERFAPTYGAWRAVVREVAETRYYGWYANRARHPAPACRGR